jgi:hypothetical protein
VWHLRVVLGDVEFHQRTNVSRRVQRGHVASELGFWRKRAYYPTASQRNTPLSWRTLPRVGSFSPAPSAFCPTSETRQTGTQGCSPAAEMDVWDKGRTDSGKCKRESNPTCCKARRSHARPFGRKAWKAQNRDPISLMSFTGFPRCGRRDCTTGRRVDSGTAQ